MIYIEKGDCPADIQADIDSITADDAWQEIPEEPGSGRCRIDTSTGIVKKRNCGTHS